MPQQSELHGSSWIWPLAHAWSIASRVGPHVGELRRRLPLANINAAPGETVTCFFQHRQWGRVVAVLDDGLKIRRKSSPTPRAVDSLRRTSRFRIRLPETPRRGRARSAASRQAMATGSPRPRSRAGPSARRPATTDHPCTASTCRTSRWSPARLSTSRRRRAR